MNARFDPVTRDDIRRAYEEGKRSARDIELERISDIAANELHALISRKYGLNLWNTHLYQLADDIATAQMKGK